MKLTKVLVLAGALLALRPAPAQQPSAQNVILVMTDGLRWQELFHGADASLLTPANFYSNRNVDALKQQFLGETVKERREKLMPFVWGTLATQGELFGDRDHGSDMYVTNGFNFSYPGYSETLTGHGDPRINSNDNIPNPNTTVLEWLNRQPGFAHRVAAFGAWETIAYIVNQKRCGFDVNASYAPLTVPPMTPALAATNEWKADSPHIWDDEVFDAPEFDTALEYIKLHQPRVAFISLGETDDWAHAGNYGEYLLSANRVDKYLERLWSTLQSMPQYKDKTTIIFTTDHGRGPDDNKGWESHGQQLPDSKYIFAGFLGAGVPASGVRRDTPALTQSQIASTLAQFLGENWNAAEPRAAHPIQLR